MQRHVTPEVVAIECASNIRTNGDALTGCVKCFVPLSEVKSIILTLKGELRAFDHSAFTSARGNSTTGILDQDTIVFIDHGHQLWPSTALVQGSRALQGSSDHTNFAFSVRLPDSATLPPSFHFSDGPAQAFVRYYLSVRVARDGWYKRDATASFVFPFLPADRRPPSPWASLLPDWPGEWTTVSHTEKLKKNIFMSNGSSTVEVQLPAMPTIPLFTRIPIKIKVTCASKPLSSSLSTTSDLEMPMLPSLSYISLSLKQDCRIGTSIHERQLRCPYDFGPVDGGSGTAGPTSTQLVEPKWVPDSGGTAKGHRQTEVFFSTTLSFDCVPQFTTHLFTVSLSLQVSVSYPRSRSTLKLCIPLKLSSGLRPRGREFDAPPPPFSEGHLDLPPSYFSMCIQNENAPE